MAIAAVMGSSAVSYADTVENFQVELGTWNGSAFNNGGATWNNTGGWAVGVTLPGQGNPMLSHQGVNTIPDGSYWLYMHQYGGGSAIRITLFGALSTRSVVYTDASDTETSPAWTLVSGTGFTASLISAPQSSDLRVNQNQVYTGGGSNWIVGLNSALPPVATPEPATWLISGTALAGLAALRRRKR